MRKIKKRIFQLIVDLLIVKSRYSEVISNNQKGNLPSLLIEAQEQKSLQFLELCRLFEIDSTEAILSGDIQSNIPYNSSNNVCLEELIIGSEESIRSLYQSILVDEEMSEFESFVLSKHLKGEEILLKKINT